MSFCSEGKLGWRPARRANFSKLAELPRAGDKSHLPHSSSLPGRERRTYIHEGSFQPNGVIGYGSRVSQRTRESVRECVSTSLSWVNILATANRFLKDSNGIGNDSGCEDPDG